MLALASLTSFSTTLKRRSRCPMFLFLFVLFPARRAGGGFGQRPRPVPPVPPVAGAERPLKAPDRIQVSGLVLIGYCFVGNPGKSRFDQTTASNFLFFGLINFMLIHHHSHSLVLYYSLSLFLGRQRGPILLVCECLCVCLCVLVCAVLPDNHPKRDHPRAPPFLYTLPRKPGG